MKKSTHNSYLRELKEILTKFYFFASEASGNTKLDDVTAKGILDYAIFIIGNLWRNK